MPETTGSKFVDANNESDGKSDVGKPKFNSKIMNIAIIVAAAASLTALYFLSRSNYLLFHGLAEVFTVVIAFAIFAIAWNSRRIMDNSYLLFIGIALLFVGGLALLHTLAYKGMGVFPNVGTNLATQLWIAMRYMLSFSLLGALLFVNRKIRPIFVFVGYALVTALLLASIFYWGNFPVAFVDPVGEVTGHLTTFKVASEYVVSAVFLCAIALLFWNREKFSGSIVKLVAAAMVVAVAADMAFTLYTDAYGVANMVGHMLNVASFYLIYKALIETGLTKPYDLLFRNMKQNEENLKRHAVEQKVLQDKLEDYNKHLEDLVEEKAKQLKDAERLAAIGQTAGMVGHDIRNPLQSIIGDLYIAKQDLRALPECEEKESLQECFDSMGKQAEYINKIILDLQDFAKPLNPLAEETDLERLAKELASNLSFPENVERSVQVAGNARIVTADSAYLRRILGNLISNAVQAMPEGGKLTVTAKRIGSNVIVDVEDTSVGIPEAVKPKLFQPLFTTKSKGQGFGLAVVKRLTEALEGTVTVDSEEGKGTKFTVTLPQKKQSKESSL